MPKYSVFEELQLAIKATAAERGSSRELAARFYDHEPDFVRQFEREWALETLRAMITRERSKARKPTVRQRLGFGTVGKIVLRSGEPYKDATATLWELQQLRKQLGATDHPALLEVVKRIDFLKPYADAKRGITFAQACKLALDTRPDSNRPKP